MALVLVLGLLLSVGGFVSPWFDTNGQIADETTISGLDVWRTFTECATGKLHGPTCETGVTLGLSLVVAPALSVLAGLAGRIRLAGPILCALAAVANLIVAGLARSGANINNFGVREGIWMMMAAGAIFVLGVIRRPQPKVGAARRRGLSLGLKRSRSH